METNNIKNQIIDALNAQKEILTDVVSKSDMDTTKQYYSGALKCCECAIDYINKIEKN